ncbi:hypothetical protein X777_07990 [Ooceraea biroi]|uniref:Uncharacterized protein n=1 Tax=Ooceraea biroi TaxID=2015173 RepID=A0A026WA32_OOCBI|nr:hypothetical protein X777_07990 [Ooceraea biroi]
MLWTVTCLVNVKLGPSWKGGREETWKKEEKRGEGRTVREQEEQECREEKDARRKDRERCQRMDT